jgi:hypothetical protein
MAVVACRLFPYREYSERRIYRVCVDCAVSDKIKVQRLATKNPALKKGESEQFSTSK